MKYTKSSGMLTLAAFAVYLYFLVKLILFKWGPVDMSVLLQQFQLTLQDPGRILLRSGNLIPFHEIEKDMNSLSVSNPLLSLNLTGNVLAFIPLGMFIPMIFRRQGMPGARVFMHSLSLSMCFELTQLLLSIGIFDVDDLILNTFGGMVGYVVFRLLRGPVKNQKKTNRGRVKGGRIHSDHA